MDTDSKQIIGDTIKDVKFSGISWRGNEGFYYSSYDKPQGSELSAKTDHHKLYFHKMGTSQKEDKVVFGSDIKRRYVDGTVTEDDRFLIVTAAESTTGNELYIMDLTVPNSSFIAIAGNFDKDQGCLFQLT
jgi:prolyl oligopeptidase